MKTKKTVLIILLAVFILGAGVSLFKVIQIYGEYSRGRAEYESLEEYASVKGNDETDASDETVNTEADNLQDTASSSEDEEPKEPSKIQVRLDIDTETLKEINPDFIGWLYYEPAEINYPVVRDRGDDYYEHHSFEQEENSSGAIFLDYVCKPNFTAFNSVIYGHNMKNGAMFGMLNELLKDPTLIDENPYFYVYTDKEILMYEIFAGYYTSAKSDTYGIQIDYTMEDKQAYLEYIDGIAQYRNEDVLNLNTLNDETMICTLSTCHGFHSGNRTVLHGVLIEREQRD